MVCRWQKQNYKFTKFWVALRSKEENNQGEDRIDDIKSYPSMSQRRFTSCETEASRQQPPKTQIDWKENECWLGWSKKISFLPFIFLINIDGEY